MKNANGTFTLTSIGGGRTQVDVSMEYKAKYGPVGVVLDLLMLKRMLGPSLDRLLAGLDHYITTGETIGKGWKPNQVAASLANDGSAQSI